MPDKMYAFTHLISETKLLALIATNADEAKVEIFTPEKRKSYYKPRSIQNGHTPPLMIGAPHPKPEAGAGAIPKAKKSGRGNGRRQSPKGFGAAHMIVEYAAKHANRTVTMKEMVVAAKARGLTQGALSVAMTGVIRKGLIERTGLGEYKALKEGIRRIAEKLPITAQPGQKTINPKSKSESQPTDQGTN